MDLPGRNSIRIVIGYRVISSWDQFFNNLDFIDIIHKRKNRYAVKNSPLNTINSDYGAIKYKGNTYFVLIEQGVIYLSWKL